MRRKFLEVVPTDSLGIALSGGRVFICVAGMPGAGKTVVAKSLSKLADKLVVMGDLVREEARRRGLKVKPRVLMQLAEDLRRERGPAVVAKLLLERLREERVVVVDGVRSLHEIEEFRKSGEVIIVAVHASPKTRFERLRKRGRKDDPRDWEQFRERDLRELRLGLGEVIALADIMLVNEDMSEALLSELAHNKVAKVLREYVYP